MDNPKVKLSVLVAERVQTVIYISLIVLSLALHQFLWLLLIFLGAMLVIFLMVKYHLHQEIDRISELESVRRRTN